MLKKLELQSPSFNQILLLCLRLASSSAQSAPIDSVPRYITKDFLALIPKIDLKEHGEVSE